MIELRRALPVEYRAVGELTAGAYLADGAMPAEDPYYNVLRDAAARAAAADLWVAVDPDGTLAPAGRGRGIGEALVRHCLALGAASGSLAMVISTAVWMTSAHRLYRRLGFVRVPERDWSPRPDVHLLAFLRPLP